MGIAGNDLRLFESRCRTDLSLINCLFIVARAAGESRSLRKLFRVSYITWRLFPGNEVILRRACYRIVLRFTASFGGFWGREMEMRPGRKGESKSEKMPS
jgi:hypothetical protein